MKKLFVTVLAFLAISTSLKAEGYVDSVRYLTSTIGQNWFISVDGNIDWWKGSDKSLAGNYSAIQWAKPDFGASINAGKWITHSLGMRLSYDVNGGKSWNNQTGPHCGHHWMFPEDWPSLDWHLNQFMYHNIHGDLMFSPIDAFQGFYNPERVYTPVLYIGMGAACVTENIFILASNHKNWELSADAGLINNFRINNVIDLHLDLKYSLQRWCIDSWSNETHGYFYADGQEAPVDNSGNPLPNAAGETPKHVRPAIIDQNLSVGAGITFNINRIYELPVNCCEEMEEMRKRLNNLEEEMNNLPAPAPCDTVVKFVNVESAEAISYPFSIFFNLDSYQLMSRRDLVNLREIANVAKANGYKIRLRGSCDSATATAEYNQKLSENRCRKIAMELHDMGIADDQIIMVPVGGVKELDPTEFDRRVLIELVKEAK